MVGIEDQLRCLGSDAALLPLLLLQQVQVVLLAIVLDLLFQVGRAEKLPFPGAAVAAGCLRCGHPEADLLLTLCVPEALDSSIRPLRSTP